MLILFLQTVQYEALAGIELKAPYIAAFGQTKDE